MTADDLTDIPSRSDLRRVLRRAAKAERRLLAREQRAERRLDRARAHLAAADKRLVQAQARVLRRQVDVIDAEKTLLRRQTERAAGLKPASADTRSGSTAPPLPGVPERSPVAPATEDGIPAERTTLHPAVADESGASAGAGVRPEGDAGADPTAMPGGVGDRDAPS